MRVVGVLHVMELAAVPPATRREVLSRLGASCVLGRASANDAGAYRSDESGFDWLRGVVKRLRGKPPFEGL
jgi:hypothetical protein